MYCTKCGKENADSAKFCVGCGNQLLVQPTSMLDDKKENGEGNAAFKIVLEDAGRNKISAIKEIRNIMNLGLEEAKDFVDGAPNTIKELATKEEAEELKKIFEAIGAKVKIEAKGNISQISKRQTTGAADRKSIPCKICSKGEMFESFRKKHNVLPGIICIILGLIFVYNAVSELSVCFGSMATPLYLQQYTSSHPGVVVELFLGQILFWVGLILLFVYKKRITGWRCDYCGSFIKKEP